MIGLGERIRARRKELGWTLERLAKEANCSKGYLCDLEKGRRSVGADLLLSIGKALGVPLEHLVNDMHEPYKPHEAVTPNLPNGLLNFAAEENTPFRHVLCLYWIQRVIVSYRTNATKGDGEADWRRLYAAIRPFLEEK